MKKRFKKIYVEITNCCNLSCSFCPTIQRTPHFMPLEDFRHILKEIKPWTDYIYLHVKGEPLLHPKLQQILAAARDCGLYVNMTTNGTLLEQTREILLSSQIRQINISLHSFEANDHQESDLLFQKYVYNAIDFARSFSPEHGITAFRLWNLPPDKNKNTETDTNVRILHMLAENFDFTGSLDPRQYITHDLPLAPKIFVSFDHEFQWPSLNSPDLGTEGSCLALKNHIAILCDGTVIPCCLDGDGIINLGNILEHSFSSIIESHRSQQMIEGFRRHTAIEPLCRRCGYRTRFS